MKISSLLRQACCWATTLVVLLVSLGCSADSLLNQPVEMMIRAEGEAVILKVQNNTGLPLELPADLVNGPRSTERSIFLVVKDLDGHLLKRCAIVEVEPERMRNFVVQNDQSRNFDIPLHVLASTYCASAFEVVAVYGVLMGDDKVKEISSSNNLVVRPKPEEVFFSAP